MQIGNYSTVLCLWLSANCLTETHSLNEQVQVPQPRALTVVEWK